MNPTLKLLCCIALCITCGHAYTADTADIVAINMEKVYLGANVFKARYIKLEKELEDAKSSMKADVENVKNLENQLSAFGNSNPQRIELEDNIEVAKFKLKLSKKRIEAGLQRKNLIMVKDNAEDLRKYLKSYCEEKGHKIVLRQLGEGLHGRNAEELRQELNQMNVLFAAKENDITDDFIAWINTKVEVELPSADGSADLEVLE